MKHRGQVSHFGRGTNARNALLKTMVTSLVEHGRITTTLAKAKELRRHAEKAITIGKKNTLQTKRLLLSRYPNLKTVEKILKQWSPHFAKRNGGYTRISKLGARIGDCAEMAVIEFLDYAKFLSAKPEKKVTKKKADSSKPEAETKKTAKKVPVPEK